MKTWRSLFDKRARSWRGLFLDRVAVAKAFAKSFDTAWSDGERTGTWNLALANTAKAFGVTPEDIDNAVENFNAHRI